MSFKTLINFRDLGEYTTADGQRIAPKRLLRSGELKELPQEDIDELVHTYNLRQIIDFRSKHEITKTPDTEIPNTTYHHIDLFLGDEDEVPVLEQMDELAKTLSPHERMLLAYKHLVTNPIAHKGLSEFLRILLNNEEGSSLWHCYAGKDRTGLTAALVLHILGVDDKVIYDDYLQSNIGRQAANEQIITQMKAAGDDQAKIDEAEVMLTVSREYLDMSFQLINENYGNIDNFIENILNFSAEDKAKFRKMYLLD